jgi:hypothetical protein
MDAASIILPSKATAPAPFVPHKILKYDEPYRFLRLSARTPLPPRLAGSDESPISIAAEHRGHGSGLLVAFRIVYGPIWTVNRLNSGSLGRATSRSRKTASTLL